MTRRTWTAAARAAVRPVAAVAVLLVVPVLTGNGRVASAGAPTRQAEPAGSTDLGQELEAYLGVPAVSGREGRAAGFVTARLAGLPVRTDRLGNVVVEIGSGAPRRLVVCPLDEPGFVVSRIEPDGYLRLSPVGPPLGPLWEQALSGHVVTIDGARGPVPGAVALRSTHLQTGDREAAVPPFSTEEGYVDVGAESAEEVADLGVRLLDPVALAKQPVRLAHGLIAAPAARVKAGCIAAVEAARALSQGAQAGSVVFAWTALDLLNGAGLDHLLHERGPFAAAIDLGWGFGWRLEHGRARPVALPGPGTGLLSDGPPPGAGGAAGAAGAPDPAGAPGGPLQNADHFDLRARSRTETRWGTTHVVHLGLPALYPGSPVEAVAVEDVARLAALLVASLGRSQGAGAATGAGDEIRVRRPPLDASPAPPAVTPAADAHERTAAILGSLVARYGVSGDEGPVRAEVSRQLPAWARPATDAAGNLLVVAGNPLPGSSPALFLAHLDEVGFRVKEVLADGRLAVERRGGLYPSVWEAQPALVHGEHGDVPAVFEPRPDWLRAEHGPLGELTVSLGAASAAEARALGARPGSTVTMPKQLLRLGRHRAVGRSMDDRVGSTALLLALRQIEPARLPRQVIFAWTVGEEIGLEGAAAIARRLQEGRPISPASSAIQAAAPLPRGVALRVYPVDTFVSADSPLESRRIAFAPLGRGAVLRAMDSSTWVPRPLIDRTLQLAGARRIPIQLGRTGGSTDGVPFLALGADMLPLSWPGRYSHSPVEVADFRDIEDLVRLIAALATSPD